MHDDERKPHESYERAGIPRDAAEHCGALREALVAAREAERLAVEDVDRLRDLLREIHWPECAVFCDVQEERHGKPCDCAWSYDETEPWYAETLRQLRDTEQALAQLAEQVEIRSSVTGYSSKLADVMRRRYGREAVRWKANHDQRKAERDELAGIAEMMRGLNQRMADDLVAAERELLIATATLRELLDPSWPLVLARNLRNAAQACRAYDEGLRPGWRLDARRAAP